MWWLAGTVVVTALGVSVLGLLALGIYDIVRPKGAPTASQWGARFFVRFPIAAFAAGLALGILAGHFLWFQTFHCS